MQMSRQELANSAGNFAGSLMRDGYSNEEIISALLDEGLKQGEAEAIVRELLKIRAENMRQAAQIHRFRGIGIMLLAFFIGMMVNIFWNGLGYLLMLAGLGYCVWEFELYNKQIKAADSVQYSSLKPR